MSDLVERLRQVQGDNDEASEAAAEIERLTMLYENVKHWEAQHLAEIERKDAVIERLLTSNARYVSEIDRLRAALQQIADDGKNCQDYCRSRARRALESKP